MHTNENISLTITAAHSWSLLECAAPGRSSQCGTIATWPHRQLTTHLGPSWSMRLPAAPRSVGPAFFLGLTANPPLPPQARRTQVSSEDVTVQELDELRNTTSSYNFIRMKSSHSMSLWNGMTWIALSDGLPTEMKSQSGILAAPHSMGPAVSWAHRQPHFLLECAAFGCLSQCGTSGVPGFTANPQYTRGPSWSMRLSAARFSEGPAASWDYRQAVTHCC